jgi:hypothetical protein
MAGRRRYTERPAKWQPKQTPKNPSTPKVCYEYQNKGTCSRKDCHFSHEKSLNNSRDTKPARAQETAQQKQARRSYNSWKKYLGDDYSPTYDYHMTRVWEGAVAILEENDRDWIQQLPKDLDSNTDRCNGRAHLKALVEKRPGSDNVAHFISVSKLFLGVITHPALLDCLAVDEFVAGIYSFLSGSNGTRAMSFFLRLCKLLEAERIDWASSIPRETLYETFLGISAALHELLRRDSRARLNEDVQELVRLLRNASEINDKDTQSSIFGVMKRCLAEVQAMIARAKGLVEDDPTGPEEQKEVASSVYPRQQVTPSSRHDNDKRDIAEVKIFPTRDEIMSDATEFLPSTDPDQPHFLTGQVERYIDTNFRLLRHDIFGDLKRALAGFMQAAALDSHILSNQKLSLGDMRTYSYINAHIANVDFNSRRGLEVQISFQQPQANRKLSVHQRQMWWEDCKRLEVGCLVSYIWKEGSVLHHSFLVISQRNIDSKQGYGLTDRADIATITAKPTTQDNRSLRDLLKSSRDQSLGVMIEFPKVIPATFVPILENLQNMQRLSLLKFAEYIIPEPCEGPSHRKVYQSVASPLYARSNGFSFPLKPILKDKNSKLSITERASCGDDALIQDIVSKTELDVGQVKALVAALTREFAFIQGPPGTGKSYLGLQVMKILLAVQDKAKLGPIIVV